ncbi:MAG TPA: M55 family metallopeptidase [Clostridia bacterium]|nr:M55 family metallopeptidase [Clostridiaceae bacterium]HXK73010.1 M55 family metallopeptidase [Clostridia bacterium]
MHIHIITDLEGISGVTTIEQMEFDSFGYEYARKRLMIDTNAAIRGAFNNGADVVTVTDGHARGKNFIDELLDSRAKKINLIDLYSQGLHKEVDAVMFVGTHAMPGTMNAFLDHVQSSTAWYNYYINNIKCGELVQGGAFLGFYGAPVIFASADEAACEEAKYFFGNIQTAPVKKALTRNKAVSYDLDYCEKMIEDRASKAMNLIGSIKPYKINGPVEIKVEFTRTDYCDNASERPNVERIDARTVIKKIPQITDYMSILL